jgi:hypothetical protein
LKKKSILNRKHLVADGLPHQIHLNVTGKNLRLQIDNSTDQTVTNYGRKDRFSLASKQSLYIGGLPTEIATKALTGFQLKQTTSMEGCISSILLTGKQINFDDPTVKKHHIQNSCVDVIDPCFGVVCQHGGQCHVNASLAEGYQCSCVKGFSGLHCQDRKRFF